MERGRTGTYRVRGERHREECGNPAPEADGEYRGVGHNLVEGVEDAHSGSYFRSMKKSPPEREVHDLPMLPMRRIHGNTITKARRCHTR